MRGDHDARGRRVTASKGLPPHAWGPRTEVVTLMGGHRSTPTCVGTTQRTRNNIRPRRVYPHMRGDHQTPLPCRTRMVGLPPHAWGPPLEKRMLSTIVRSTPTCVGTTPLSCLTRPPRGVYPHMRGDHRSRSKPGPPSPGLPPHAWGPQLVVFLGQALHGSTPTCVGTTCSSGSTPPKTRVYPHMRGDHFLPSAVLEWGVGLPPHAWGPPGVARAGRRAAGSTPTCVGTTLRSGPVGYVLPVYPHMRGDHLPLVGLPAGLGGLPPHAWGPRCPPRPARRRAGLPPHAWGPRVLGK